MNEFKSHNSPDPRDSRDNRDKLPAAEPLAAPRDIDDLPISNWDDYKNWCEKVKQNWDVN